MVLTVNCQSFFLIIFIINFFYKLFKYQVKLKKNLDYTNNAKASKVHYKILLYKINLI